MGLFSSSTKKTILQPFISLDNRAGFLSVFAEQKADDMISAPLGAVVRVFLFFYFFLFF